MDFQRAAMLLHVAEKAQLWPSLHPLRDAALKELEKIQAPDEPKAAPPRVPFRAIPSTEEVRKV